MKRTPENHASNPEALAHVSGHLGHDSSRTATVRLICPPLKLIAVVLAILVGLCLFAPAQEAYAAQNVSFKVSGKVDYTQSYKFLNKLNKLRKQQGLKPLVMDKALLKAAEQRAAELSVVFAHTRPNGSKCFSVSKYAMGENIAFSTARSANTAYKLWRNSPPHYKNMRKSSYRTAGVCCFYRAGVYYWVNLFGISKSGKAKKISGVKSKSVKIKLAKKYLKKSALDVRAAFGNGGSKGSAVVFFTTKASRDSGAQGINVLPNSLFKFKSSNTNVFTVDKSGNLYARQSGSAKLTATLKAGKACSVSDVVEVG